MAMVGIPGDPAGTSPSDQLMVHRFADSFLRWTRHDPDRFDRLWFPLKLGRKRITLRLRRFSPHLRVELRRNGYDVAVIWAGSCWDLLRSVDLVPVQGEDGRWSCDLCLGPVQPVATLEALWIDHLFSPMTDWAEGELASAELLCLSRARGATWATLEDRAAPLPVGVTYAVIAGQADEPG